MGKYVFAEKYPPPLTPQQARAMLPRVGDRMRKIPTTLKIADEDPRPAWCTVVYVNTAHLWYTVQFQEKGCRFRESYKVPERYEKEA